MYFSKYDYCVSNTKQNLYQMKFKATFYNNAIVIKMPCNGIIRQLPNVEDKINFYVDNLIKWKGENSNFYKIQKNENSNSIKFETKYFNDEIEKTFKELDLRREYVENYKKKFENISLYPQFDPTMYQIGKNDDKRIEQLKEIFLEILWDDNLINLASETIEEPFPILEYRIEKVLNLEKVNLCSKLFTIEKSAIITIACEIFAVKIRETQTDLINLNFRNYELQNPSVKFQKININDLILYKKHTISDTFENFEDSFLTYYNLSLHYWECIGEKKLFNIKDYKCLREWGILSNTIDIITGKTTKDLVVNSKFPSPLAKLEVAKEEFLKIKERFKIDKLIILKISQIGLVNWYDSSFPSFNPINGPLNEQINRWVATQAIELINAETDLNLGNEYIEGHLLTWDRIKELCIKFLMIDFTSGDPIELADQNSRLDFIYNEIAPQAVNIFISDNLEYRFKHIYGGGVIRLTYFNYEDRNERELHDELLNLNRDTTIFQNIINESFINPYILDVKLSELSKAYPKNLLYHYSRTTQLGAKVTKFDKYWLYDLFNDNRSQVLDKLNEYYFVLQNVAQIKTLNQFYVGIINKLNSENYNEGNISLSIDSKVISVYAKKNEYLEENSPIVLLKQRFRKTFKIFLAHNNVSYNLYPNSIWAVNNFLDIDLPNGILCFIHILKIEPQSSDYMVIDGEFFTSIDSDLLPLNSLSKLIPVSSRFLNLEILPFITEEFLDRLEESISKLTSDVEIEFLNPII